MNLQEAYSQLGVPDNLSDDELKAKYKELAKKYHPDIFKEDPDKFKKINEAYQTIQEYKSGKIQEIPFQQSNYYNIGDLFDFGNFNFGNRNTSSRVHNNLQPPQINTTISFKESILGCEKELNYKRYIKCDSCDGTGFKNTSNGCKHCDGFGKITKSGNGVHFTQSCNKCYAKGVKRNKCNDCNNKGVVEKALHGTVQIPAGISSGNGLRLQGLGHFVNSSFIGDSYGDAFVSVVVNPEQNMRLVNQDVVSDIDISLLEALEGSNKEVNTIFDKRQIQIPAGSKNKDEINVDGCGVKNTKGVHKFILNIVYPEKIKELIEWLKV